MIHFELMSDKGILIVTPAAPLEKEDIEKLTQEVDALIESQGRLNGLMIYAESFPGWKDFEALVAHLNFCQGPSSVHPEGGCSVGQWDSVDPAYAG